MELRDGIRKSDKQLFTHENLHQTNPQVDWHSVGAPLVLGQVTGDFGLTRLTTARTRGKP
jgi:hypothetical protein